MKKVISERDFAKKHNLTRVDLIGHGLFLEFDEKQERIRIGGVRPRFQEIKYNAKGKAFIAHQSHRVYLDTFKKY